MIRVIIELDKSTTAGDRDRVFDVANWVAATLSEEMMSGLVIHSILVEEDS